MSEYGLMVTIRERSAVMCNPGEIRWKQRLSHLTKAMAQLEAACGKEDYTELERAGQ